MDGYYGEIKMFAGNYPPANWVYCQGQLLSVAEHSALYAILGVTYGGDGRSSFGVPDLRGRIPIGSGTGPGLSTRYIGMKGGYERIYLYESQLPSHSHTIKCDTTSGLTKVSNTPENNLFGKNAQGTSYGSSESASLMNSDMINATGNNDMFDIIPPYKGINFIMCVEGQWPPRS